MRIFAKALVTIILGFQLSGCALLVGAAAGAGGVVWVKGRLQQELNTAFDKTHNATLVALKKLGLPLNVDRKDAFSAKVQSKFSDGTNVWIDLEYMTKNSTKITIRVGVVGDQARSNRILEMIKKNL